MFHIIIVEDNQKYREALLSALTLRFPDAGITEVESAEQCLENLSEDKPDLLLVDIRLPGMNGLELTRKIKTDHPEIKIILMTLYDMLEYRQKARQYQSDDFINKNSTSLEEISSIVEKYMPT